MNSPKGRVSRPPGGSPGRGGGFRVTDARELRTIRSLRISDPVGAAARRRHQHQDERPQLQRAGQVRKQLFVVRHAVIMFPRMTKTIAAFVIALSLSVPAVAFAEPQPHMKAALESLKKAKEQLEKATADKGGHRAKAIELVTNAIEQTEKGINFDNKH
jgi:hypothetical protein